MANQYKIYLINQSSSMQTFWCFLTRPEELASDPKVFANSSASISIDPNDPSTNSFTIPVQYVVGAGASNNAVGLNVKIDSTITQDALLSQVWDAAYVSLPPKKGPKLTLDSATVSDKMIKIITNPFDQENNEANDWYSSQSFGIQTAAGFMGMTWSPSPNQARTLTPKLNFYVNVGNFDSSTLADWTDVGNDAAVISVPGSFSAGACTVTLLNNGKWSVVPGKPMQLTMMENLPFLKTDACGQLMAMAYLADGTLQQDTVKSVHWNKTAAAAPEEVDLTFLSGTITVATALTAAFTYFVLSGVQFTVTNVSGGTTVDFTYNGTLSAQAIHDLLVTGAQIVFGK